MFPVICVQLGMGERVFGRTVVPGASLSLLAYRHPFADTIVPKRASGELLSSHHLHPTDPVQ